MKKFLSGKLKKKFSEHSSASGQPQTTDNTPEPSAKKRLVSGTAAPQRQAAETSIERPAPEITPKTSLPKPSPSWQQWTEEPYPAPAQSKDVQLGLNLTLKDTFTYDALDETVDSTRLLEIKPHLRPDGLLDCSLISVKFGDRPQFDALSYMWGTNDATEPICVDGASFKVTKNLFDALHFLRRRPDSSQWKPIWVDAICINQKGNADKNRQLPFMPHIYERARQVIVWLGKDYETFQKPETEDLIRQEVHRRNGIPDDDEVTRDFNMVQNPNGGYRFNEDEKAMVRKLNKDSYWGRVWIIQEIGKARRIKVCFGKMSLNWAEFICFVTRFDRIDHGPVKFNTMNKNRQGRKLKELLEQHRDAKCGQAKDKIYGLLGLALDSGGFPVDYGQPDLRTWADTMNFASSRSIVSPDEILDFAEMVKGLLVNHPEAQTPEPSILDNMGRPASKFPLGAIFIGWVGAIGPTTTEVISSLGSLNEWQRDHFEEKDKLRLALLDTDDEAIGAMLTSETINVFRSAQNMSLSGKLIESGPGSLSQRTHVNGAGSKTLAPARLFKLYSDRSWGTDDSSKLGIISTQAHTGDSLCYLKELQEIVVLRKEDRKPGTIRIVGKALLTKSILSGKPLGASEENIEGSGKVSIKVDAKTLWQLTQVKWRASQAPDEKPIITERHAGM